jgi:adenylate cyclase
MSDIFISYARSTATDAAAVADALRSLGYDVWLDDDLPAHRTYAEVIAERLASAKAVVVIWSAEAAKSEWVQSEADRARGQRKLVQLTIDGAALPMPFDRIQCADLAGWTGDLEAPGWRKVVASIGELMNGAGVAATSVAPAPLSLPSKPSIAVLPFANLSGDPEQDYFADGMVVEITNALSRFKSIFVIASGSALSFKGTGSTPREAARQLGVRYVLEGSVRKAGARVRIAAQLIDAADGRQIWSDRFEDTLEDVFDLQDRVALGVAGRIEPTVREAEIRRASARPTDSMGSYDLYLRAHLAHRSFARAGVLEGLDLVERAIAIDPGHARALSTASFLHYLITQSGWSDDPAHHRREAVTAAHRALKAASDDTFVLANTALVTKNFEGDLDGALVLLDRALTLNPGSATAWLISGFVRLQAGDTDAAVEHLGRAMRLDPMGPDRPVQMGFMGIAFFELGRFGDAVAHLKQFVEQAESSLGFGFLAACYGHLGEAAAARDALDRYQASSPVPIDDFGRQFLNNPSHVRLFMDGIALAKSEEGAAASPDG